METEKKSQSTKTQHDLEEIFRAAAWFREWWNDGADRVRRAELQARKEEKKTA